MNKYLVGIVSSFLAMLLGAWLMVSPFALGGQGSGDWSGQTQVEFWTGLGVLVVAVLAQIAYGQGLNTDLRARGVVQPRPAPVAEVPEPVSVAPAADPRLEDMLAPLIAALQQDLGQQTGHLNGQINGTGRHTAPNTQSARMQKEGGNA